MSAILEVALIVLAAKDQSQIDLLVNSTIPISVIRSDNKNMLSGPPGQLSSRLNGVNPDGIA